MTIARRHKILLLILFIIIGIYFFENSPLRDIFSAAGIDRPTYIKKTNIQR